MFIITKFYDTGKGKMLITVETDLPEDEMELAVQDHLDNEFDDEWMVIDSVLQGPGVYEVFCEDIGA